ncbi:endonuclease/exonuclease/phosphatase family protein [Sphingobacterium pedocola]|uniref:Endonuclease n=1 Tax=Sphingobacterium pedocola TaxID=2082722 RepID=A0ABR9T781_9SPHI|nr:endonuclease/exonuclease/phosphatase family protein [Sphingobacterium pedocola]MBE8721198.1 endonuclease [Sphingobacterium pedocola]
MIYIKNIITFCFLACLALGCTGKEGLTRDFEDDLTGPGAGKTDKLSLVAGSYNLRLITANDQGILSWDNRKQWVKKIIQDHDFDILGTQEGVLAQINDITAHSSYAYVGVGRDNGTTQGETCAILYKQEKYTVESSGTFWLSQTPDVPSYGWDANIRRICTWVKFKDKATGTLFFVFNAHYDHQGAVAKLESSKLIIAQIKLIAGNLPVVMTGDLNALPNSEPIAALLQSNLLWDAKVISKTAAQGPEGTSYGYDLSKEPTGRIDHVLVSKTIDVQAFKIIDDDFKTGNIASDHLPVYVQLEL